MENKTREEMIEEVVKHDFKSMNEHGFYIHYVPDAYNNGYIDCHTHGLKESFNHREIQLTNVGHENAAGIIHGVVDLIKNGRTITDCELLDGVIKDNYVLTVWSLDEEDNQVIRLAFPLIDDKECYVTYNPKSNRVEYFTMNNESKALITFKMEIVGGN